MTPRAAMPAALVIALALPAVAAAQVHVARGSGGAEETGLTVETEIDPSGLSAPVTIVRGRVRAAPPPPVTVVEPAPQVAVYAGYPYRALWRHGLWAVPGRAIHDVWYSWMGGFRQSLAEDIVFGPTYNLR